MGLTGIQIFKLLPKTNCGECGVPTCLAFAMNLAAAKAELDSCPYVSDEAKEKLSEASAPPIRQVTAAVPVAASLMESRIAGSADPAGSLNGPNSVTWGSRDSPDRTGTSSGNLETSAAIPGSGMRARAR